MPSRLRLIDWRLRAAYKLGLTFMVMNTHTIYRDIFCFAIILLYSHTLVTTDYKEIISQNMLFV